MTRGTIIVRNCSACCKYIMQQNIESGNTAHSRLWTDGKRKGPHLPDQAWLSLVKCPHCSALLWIKELEEVCEIDPWGPDCIWPSKVKIVKKEYEPSLDEHVHFENADAQEKEEEQYAQFRAWKAEIELSRQRGEAEPKVDLCDMTDQLKDARLVSEPGFEEYIDFLSAGIQDREKEWCVRIRAWWAGNDPRRQGGQASPMTQVEMTNLRSLLPFLDESSDTDRLRKAECLRELGAFAAAEKLLATQFDNRLLKAVNLIRNLCQRGSASVEEIPTSR